jgi:hypothetical protein
MTPRRAVPAALVGLVLVGALAASTSTASRTDATTSDRAERTPVASLDPGATAREWRRLVAHPQRQRFAADCRPLRGIFYAATDWLRLATRLAANASSCAQYYVSVPALATDKTAIRPDQAWRIRALGSNFHAMAEIHWAGWGRWVASTGSSWFAAGVEARRRMAAAGFDVSKGDIWALNELPSSVRAIAGPDRANAREFVRGLYQGEGGPPVKGTVFVIGVGQRSNAVPLYQNNLQNWLTDSAFWTDMSAYVSDWSQEVYSDFRSYGVPGAPPATRRDYLNDYLQHALVLAGVGPPAIDAARAFLQATYSPLANAAWQWDSSYGWTMVPFDQMEDFVSAQTYALRAFSVAGGQPRDHWGFAWQPRNATGLTSPDFTNQTAAILDRLAIAIRDSAETNPTDPGGGACGPPGQSTWCGGDLTGAAFTEAWKSFRTWTQPVLVFTSAPQTIPVATPSAAMTLGLQTSTGGAQTALNPITVTLTSSSPNGQFATDPAGPWSPTLTLTIPAGGNAAGPFYYQDTRAGGQVLTASAPGLTSGTQTETVLPGPIIGVSVKPTSVTLAARGSTTLAASGIDSYGNAVQANATWSVAPTTVGSVLPKTGPTTAFTAGPRGGTGTVTAILTGATGPLSAGAAITVRPGGIKVASIRYGIGRTALLVSAAVVDTVGRPVAGASVSVVVRRRGYPYFSGRATTTATGRAIYRVRPKKGCYRTTVTRVSAPGYVWRVGTPANRFCK